MWFIFVILLKKKGLNWYLYFCIESNIDLVVMCLYQFRHWHTHKLELERKKKKSLNNVNPNAKIIVAYAMCKI
jgi:hypothetical protein